MKYMQDVGVFFIGLMCVVLISLLVYLQIYLIKSLWNQVLSPVTGFAQIDGSQAYALSLLVTVLH